MESELTLGICSAESVHEINELTIFQEHIFLYTEPCRLQQVNFVHKGSHKTRIEILQTVYT